MINLDHHDSTSISFSRRPLISESIRPIYPIRLRIISPYVATKGTHIRSSLHTFFHFLITFIPIKLPRTGNVGERYPLYPGACTRSHRMVMANDPSPDTYTLVFISAGFMCASVSTSFFFSLFLFLRLTFCATISCPIEHDRLPCDIVLRKFEFC